MENKALEFKSLEEKYTPVVYRPSAFRVIMNSLAIYFMIMGLSLVVGGFLVEFDFAPTNLVAKVLALISCFAFFPIGFYIKTNVLNRSILYSLTSVIIIYFTQLFVTVIYSAQTNIPFAFPVKLPLLFLLYVAAVLAGNALAWGRKK